MRSDEYIVEKNKKKLVDSSYKREFFINDVRFHALVKTFVYGSYKTLFRQFDGIIHSAKTYTVPFNVERQVTLITFSLLLILLFSI